MEKSEAQYQNEYTGEVKLEISKKDHVIKPKITGFIRFLEIFPGAVMWLAFILPFVLSFTWPAIVATYVLIFDLYWLYKSIIMGANLVWSYRRLHHDMRVDWLEKCKNLDKDPLYLDWKNIYHAVVFAASKEEPETLLSSVEALINSDFPLNRVILVLATEKRYAEAGKVLIDAVEEKYGHKFFKFLPTIHPDIPGEVKAKGANAKWAVQHLKELIDKEGIAYENVIITTADADTRFYHRYLSALTYQYIINPNREHRSFQPIPLYSNNIWHAPFFSRVISFGNSFWQLIEASRPWRMINFSTHAMSLKTLVEIDYWDVTVVNEDSRQFWRAYFCFDGDHEVVPLFVPVYMDAVLAGSYWQTIKNQYYQKRRWYYGVEHFPYVVASSIENKKISFWDKSVKIYRLFEGNYSLATSSIYIMVVAWLPLYFGPGFQGTVLAQNLPLIIRILLSLTWVGLVISVCISILLLPPKPRGFGRRKSAEMLFQWICIPVTAIIFSSIPAIDAQTRLMLGKYMTFWVTEKKAIK